MEKVALKADIRKPAKKSSLKTLRKNGRVPGVYYSTQESLTIEVPENAINPLVFTAQTHLITLQIEGQEEKDCIIKDIQFDPVTDKVVHFDLIGLKKGEKIQIEVPIQYIGSAVGVKEGGILQTILHKLEVECFPKDLPQYVQVSVENLKIGDSIHASDLTFENLTILELPDAVLVTVAHPKIEKEPTPEEAAAAAAEEPAEPELITKKKPEEEEEEEEE
ncbi:MAG TPA: 50S ribosomal protein L25 [Ignavibacteriaceae bacterium]|nr:50S ribosomal protein L25 [Ignavibacteriaceae bacterium]